MLSQYITCTKKWIALLLWSFGSNFFFGTHKLYLMTATPQAKTGIITGLNHGHITTKKALPAKPVNRKGVSLPFSLCLTHFLTPFR